jgi:hypothetical protein
MWGTSESQTKPSNVNMMPPTTKAPFVKRIFISGLFFGLIQYTTFLNVNAQIVRFIQNPYQAEYYIFETTDSSLANYFVYKASNPTEAIREGVWFIADDPFIYRDKAIRLHRVKSASSADLVVYYVRNPKNAGKSRARARK